MADKAPKARKGSNREYLIKKLLDEPGRRISQKDRVRLREIVGLPPEPALKKGGAVKRKTGGTAKRQIGGATISPLARQRVPVLPTRGVRTPVGLRAKKGGTVKRARGGTAKKK
jgi:hypothetical protein